MPVMADSGCVSRAARGDEQAFAELVQRYRDAVYGLCYHRVGQAEEARDLAQEAFLRAYLDLPQLRDPEAFPAWLRRVTDRVCSTWLRRRRLEVVSLTHVPEPATESDLSLPVAVRQALDRLSEPARLAVMLCYIDGYSVSEVARFLEVPVGTVKSRLHNARQRLRGELMSEFRDALREGAPGDEFTGAVVRAVRSLEEGKRLPYAQYFDAESEQDLKRYLVLEKDGTVLGVSYYGPEDIPLRGVTVHAARCSVTSGEHDWHKEGGLDAYDRLAPAALANLAEMGFPVAISHEQLLPATRHGYVPCFYHFRITAPAANLARGETRGTVRPYQSSDHDSCLRLRTLPRARPAFSAWGPGERPAFVLERDGLVVGYCAVSTAHRWVPPRLMSGVEAMDMAAYQALAKHAAEEALREGEDILSTYYSPDHPLGALLLSRGGCCEVQGASWNLAKDEELVCLLDLGAALRTVARGLGHARSGQVSIDMDGQLVTVTAGEPPAITHGAKGPTSHISRIPMTQLLVGYHSVFEIASRSDVAIREEHLALLDALFPKAWPYTWPDPYIWYEESLLEDKPFIAEEPWRSKLAAQPRPWAV